jgi:polyisoprenoid-binding protein YceI
VNGVFTPRNWKARTRIGHTGVVMSSRSRLLALVLLSATALGARAAPHAYRFDRVHTQILFSVGHDGFSNALGMLHIAAGWMRFDPDDWSASRCELDIDLAGVDMGDAAWSRAVRGSGLLDADHHRYAHFVSTSARKTGKNEGVLEGRLTLRGITRPVRIAFRLNRNAPTIFAMGRTVAGFTGSAQLDRTDFGITRNPGSIGRTVTVRLEIEAQRDADAQSAYRKWKASHAAAQ